MTITAQRLTGNFVPRDLANSDVVEFTPSLLFGVLNVGPIMATGRLTFVHKNGVKAIR